MADAYTATAGVNSVQAAYDRLAYFALRPQLYFDRVADVRPTVQTAPGSSVKFTKYTDLSVATSALNESVDVDAVALTDAQVTLNLTEHGNAVVTTAKLRGTSFLNVDADAANIVGFNAGRSLDALALAPLSAGLNVGYGGTRTARNTVTPTDVLDADDVRKARTFLAKNNVMPWPDGLYRAFIHPDVAYDLRRETGAAAWRDPHTYSQPGEIWNGTVGAFEGFSFIETSTAPFVADAGSSTTLTDVYQTIFVGRQALAKAYSSAVSGPVPKVVQGPTVDKLRRFNPIGWLWLGSFGRFREEAIYRFETGATLGANS
jgi:N4-gp56 family major capsid protein